MDSELVSDSETSEKTRGGEESENGTSSPLAYTDIFNENFPYYLSIGMSYEEYWNKDADLVKSYRRADEYKRERKNQELWLQGLYVYTAMANLSPIFHDFAKKGTKAEPYPDKPYPITSKEVREEKERKERKRYERLMSYMKRKQEHLTEEEEVTEDVD